MDDKTTLNEIKLKVKKFCDDRDWRQYHDAKELSTALVLEAAELLEPFRYKAKNEVEGILSDKAKKAKVEDEMADVLFLLLRLSDVYNVDLSQAFEKKIKETAEKYPVDKVKGLNKKYDEY